MGIRLGRQSMKGSKGQERSDKEYRIRKKNDDIVTNKQEDNPTNKQENRQLRSIDRSIDRSKTKYHSPLRQSPRRDGPCSKDHVAFGEHPAHHWRSQISHFIWEAQGEQEKNHRQTMRQFRPFKQFPTFLFWGFCWFNTKRGTFDAVGKKHGKAPVEDHLRKKDYVCFTGMMVRMSSTCFALSCLGSGKHKLMEWNWCQIGLSL